MAHKIPQAHFLAVIPYYIQLFTSVATAYIDNAAHKCAPPTYAMITPSPHAEPYPVTKQGQQITTFVPKYAVCNLGYKDCTTAYEASSYSWCSTRLPWPCYGSHCTITDCNQLVTFSHTQSYSLNSVQCVSAGNCHVYGTDIHVPSPTTKTYVEPIHTYFAAPYLEYLESTNPAITVNKCVESQPRQTICSAHVEHWEEQYVVHTSMEIIPVTLHTYCTEATTFAHDNQVIHVTAPTTLTYLTELKKTTLYTETLTAKVQWDNSWTASADASTATGSSNVKSHQPVSSSTISTRPCSEDACTKPVVQAHKPVSLMEIETHKTRSTCTEFSCISPESATTTPCITSTTYISLLSQPTTSIAPIAQPTTAPIIFGPSIYYEEPLPAPSAPVPISVPSASPCEGAYCPKDQPTLTPIAECKGYGCPAPALEPIPWEPDCSGVSCPEHNYGDHVPQPIEPVDTPCEGYDCGGEDHEELEGYQFGFEDDEMIHSDVADVTVDMEGGDVNVTVRVDAEMDLHNIMKDF